MGVQNFWMDALAGFVGLGFEGGDVLWMLRRWDRGQEHDRIEYCKPQIHLWSLDSLNRESIGDKKDPSARGDGR